MTRTHQIVALAFTVVTSLAGCAARGTESASSHSAYDRICRSPQMTEAAGREAFWCWQAAGAASYEQWVALEKAGSPAGEPRGVVASGRVGDSN